MKALAQFVIRLADLVEAEGRAVRRAIFRLAMALLILLVSAALVLAAIGFFLASLFLLLAPYVTPAGALAILGGGLLILAVVCLSAANRTQNKGGRAP